MKYQIYLKKETSELLNGIAKATNKKPATFIKEFLEECFKTTEKVLDNEALEEVKKYGRE